MIMHIKKTGLKHIFVRE